MSYEDELEEVEFPEGVDLEEFKEGISDRNEGYGESEAVSNILDEFYEGEDSKSDHSYDDTLIFVMNEDGVRCNFDCDHCGTRAGQDMGRDLTKSDYIDIIQEAGSYEEVVFTGGIEPTLVWNDIVEDLVEIASEEGYDTRMVTNGWWANGQKGAKKWAKDFSDSGLDTITCSYDAYHLEDLEKISKNDENAADIGARVVRSALRENIEPKFFPVFDKETFGENVHLFKQVASSLTESEGKHVSFLYDRENKSGFLQLPNKTVNINFGLAGEIGFGEERLDSSNLVQKSLIKSSDFFACPSTDMVVHPDGSGTPCCGFVESELENYSGGDLREKDLWQIKASFIKDEMFDTISDDGFSQLVRDISSLASGEVDMEGYLESLTMNDDSIDLEGSEIEEVKEELKEVLFSEYGHACSACHDIREVLNVE